MREILTHPSAFTPVTFCYCALKILLISYAFSPSVGGIESASEVLAAEFVQAGHHVILVTKTSGSDGKKRNFEVVRKPGIAKLFSCYRWADIIFQNNLSLRLLWPLGVIRKVCFVTTQTWLSGAPDLSNRNSRIKHAVLKRCKNIAISKAVEQHLGLPSVVLGNPYDASNFRKLAHVKRSGMLLFVGRLVSDKGLDLLLEAILRLRAADLRPHLTVVGEGPERGKCEAFVACHGLKEQVAFAGEKRGNDLAELMNAHHFLVVPSRWAEPFGIVALEAIACGCVVVGSKDGGLKEAIGPCGITFQNGSIDSLAESLRLALTQTDAKDTWTRAADVHLQQFKSSAVAARYLQLFATALK